MTNIFNHLIITAPSESIANVYKLQSESLYKELPCLTNVKIHCVADPKGVRIGSGGGTLNALDYLISNIGIDKVKESKVLIIHSGGDSRRSPLHSVCGKAWSSINSTIHQYSNSFSTPMALLIKELSEFCINIDIGAVVIASSDVMLDIYNGICSPLIPSNAVSVVVVPELPSIAQNHGVLIVDLPTMISCDNDTTDTTTNTTTTTNDINNNNNNNNWNTNNINNTQYKTSLASNYLQKPSIQVMKDANAIKYSTTTKTTRDCDNDANGTVLIDTGIVIFTGNAYYSLLALLDNEVISLCTERGLVSSRSSGKTCTNNSYLNALRLELYSDLLMSLSLSNVTSNTDTSTSSSSVSGLSSYITKLGLKLVSNENESTSSINNYRKSLCKLKLYIIIMIIIISYFLLILIGVIWNTLHSTPLYAIAVENGIFSHLGTSWEFLTFLTSINKDNINSNINSNIINEDNIDNSISNKDNKLMKLANKFSLQNSVSCKYISSDRDFSSDRDSIKQDTTGITINSCFIFNNSSCNNSNNTNTNTTINTTNNGTDKRLSIGSSSVVEHCLLDTIDSRVNIGNISISISINIYI
jgi:hypothetical protein